MHAEVFVIAISKQRTPSKCNLRKGHSHTGSPSYTEGAEKSEEPHVRSR